MYNIDWKGTCCTYVLPHSPCLVFSPVWSGCLVTAAATGQKWWQDLGCYLFSIYFIILEIAHRFIRFSTFQSHLPLPVLDLSVLQPVGGGWPVLSSAPVVSCPGRAALLNTLPGGPRSGKHLPLLAIGDQLLVLFALSEALLPRDSLRVLVSTGNKWTQ